MALRDYSRAVAALNTLQSNAQTLAQAKWTGYRPAAAIPEMLEYLGRIGYKPNDLNALNVIHITGTKGKGSTCAFTDSLIRTLAPQRKVGLYTSPHLVAVRERIRVNGAPISESDFARFFFEVWDRLEENDVRASPETAPKPGYFKMLTLVAYHAFLSLKVDATILEVGIGGTYDSTNLVPKPLVTGVSSLGLDHVSLLGNTLADIGWQKGGIYKEGVPALSVPQPPEGHRALENRAKEKGASYFKVIGTDSLPGLNTIKLGLSGAHQYINATLAVHLARTYFASVGADAIKDPSSENITKPNGVETSKVNGHIELLTPLEIRALENARWPGRCQVVPDPSPSPVYGSRKGRKLTWFLDGAHTVESLTCCIEWFASPDVGLRPLLKGNEQGRKRVLVFNCTNGRSGVAFLGCILDTLRSRLAEGGVEGGVEEFFSDVVFTTNVTYASGNFKPDLTAVASLPVPSSTTPSTTDASLATASTDTYVVDPLKVQNELAKAWTTLLPHFPQHRVHVVASLEETAQIVRGVQEEVEEEGQGELDVLVSGSLHLVGGVIEVAGLSEVAL